MARGKYLSLEEARKLGKLKEFAKQHPSEETRAGRFDALLDTMTKSSPEADQTSGAETSEDCTETRTPRGTSEDASD